MKKTALVVLIVMTILAAASSIAWAEGGSSKGKDVCWSLCEEGCAEHSAIFYETGSGIVHEWRYEVQDAHLIFMPQDKFPNEPQGLGWHSGQFIAGLYYDCDPASSYPIDDILDDGKWYWVLDATVQ